MNHMQHTAVATPDAAPQTQHELIVGGQRSGKSRRAEHLAKAWLAQGDGFGATFIATAQALDEDMQARIARHRADRAEHLPCMACVEEPLHLAQAVLASAAAHDPQHLLVIDCLTLWLSNLMHAHGAFAQAGEGDGAAQASEGEANRREQPTDPLGAAEPAWQHALHAHTQALLQALAHCRGPVVLVSNEVGLGIMPMGREVRAYVDALGRLNQHVAQACGRVCLMVAGQSLMIKQP